MTKTYKVMINGKEYDVKGCPFCGVEPEYSYDGIDWDDFSNSHSLRCESDGCKGAHKHEHDDENASSDDALDKLIKEWNTRA